MLRKQVMYGSTFHSRVSVAKSKWCCIRRLAAFTHNAHEQGCQREVGMGEGGSVVDQAICKLCAYSSLSQSFSLSF